MIEPHDHPRNIIWQSPRHTRQVTLERRALHAHDYVLRVLQDGTPHAKLTITVPDDQDPLVEAADIFQLGPLQPSDNSSLLGASEPVHLYGDLSKDQDEQGKEYYLVHMYYNHELLACGRIEATDDADAITRTQAYLGF